MKLLYTILFFLLSSCVNHIEENEESVNITFNIQEYQKLPFDKSTRGDLSASCSHLAFIDYSEGKLKKKIEQSSDEVGFGTLSLNLSFGTHELLFIGYNQDAITINENDLFISFPKISDTFTYYVTTVVDNTTDKSQTISLLRRVAKFELLSTDQIPNNVSSLDVVATGGCTILNGKTGKGSIVGVQSKTINIPSNLVGTSNNTFSCYTFLMSEKSNMTFSIKWKDSGGKVLYTKEFTEVPMEINSITRYTGKVFSNDINVDKLVTVSNVWSKTNEVNF